MGKQQKINNKNIAMLWLLIAGLVILWCPFIVSAAPSSVDVELEVEQIFEHLGVEEDVADAIFNYKLTAAAAENPMPAGSVEQLYYFSITNTNKETITFSCDQAGIFSYQLEQIIPAQHKGFTYDTAVYEIQIQVQAVDAGLVANVLVMNSSGDKVTAITFNNAYEGEHTDSLVMEDPAVRKTVSGTPTTKSEFTFTLTAADASNPMPEGSSDGVKQITISGSGENEFGVWSYERPGTYYYTVSEEDTGESGYAYDTSIYTIVDVVEDVNGQLTLKRIVTNDANRQVTACDFINHYTGPGTGGGSGGGSGEIDTDKGTSNPNGVFGPKTGDSFSMSRYWILLSVSGVFGVICAVYLIVEKKRRNRVQADDARRRLTKDE